MNNDDGKSTDTYRSFLLMEEIAREEPLTQRDLSRRLDIALGLVNSYLKNLVAKGYVRIKAFPRNRYAYILTPQGLAEKSRLAYHHLSYFTNLYRIARHDYAELFRSIAARGVRSVSFCGVDEVAEIAFLSLKETAISLSAVMDDERAGTLFFDKTILTLAEGVLVDTDRIIITSFKQREAFHEKLLHLGIKREMMSMAGNGVNL